VVRTAPQSIFRHQTGPKRNSETNSTFHGNVIPWDGCVGQRILATEANCSRNCSGIAADRRKYLSRYDAKSTHTKSHQYTSRAWLPRNRRQTVQPPPLFLMQNLLPRHQCGENASSSSVVNHAEPLSTATQAAISAHRILDFDRNRSRFRSPEAVARGLTLQSSTNWDADLGTQAGAGAAIGPTAVRSWFAAAAAVGPLTSAGQRSRSSG
jgi:hypothetical protein